MIKGFSNLVTSRGNKKMSKFIAGCAGGGATICVALFTWGFNMSEQVTINTTELKKVHASVEGLSAQYRDYDKKLTELIHKQDKRITLLENLIDLKLNEGEKHAN